MGWKQVLAFVTVTVWSVAGAQGAVVDREPPNDIVLGTTDGAPTCAADRNGYLHVVYSRNDRDVEATRSDIYYRRVDTTTRTVSPEVCLTAGLGTWTGDLSPAIPAKNPKNTSFHMSPRIAVDSTGRVHVVFAGYGDMGWDYNHPLPYNTQLAYLNFQPDQVLAWNNRAACPLGSCGVIVPNAYRADLDLVQPTDEDEYLSYSRMDPNITLEERTDLGTTTVWVHAAFASASGICPANGYGGYLRISHARFPIGSDAQPDLMALRTTHVDSAWNGSFLIGAGDAGVNLSHPSVVAQPLSGDKVRIFASFVQEIVPTPYGYTENAWGDYLVDLSLVEGPRVTVLDRSPWSDPPNPSLSPRAYRVACGLDAHGRLHAAGEKVNAASTEMVVLGAVSGEDPPVAPAAVRIPGDFAGNGNFGRGGCQTAQRFYAVLGGNLVFLGEEPGFDAQGLQTDPSPSYRYRVTPVSPTGECCDLATWTSGGVPRMAVVHATGVNGAIAYGNDWGCTERGNLRLTLFAEPSPATDVVAWISYPQQGSTVYVSRKALGKVTLQAEDGAPGAGEVYTWSEGANVLGTGQTLTCTLGDGTHTVTLNVGRSGPDGSWLEDEATVGFAVKTGTAPATSAPVYPDILVSPTTGLVTTETGGKATFTVVLATQPTADVTITLHSSDTSEGLASPTSLTFTPASWAGGQTVTVTGRPDDLADGAVGYRVLLDPAESDDRDYNRLHAPDVQVVNQEQETVVKPGKRR